LAANRLRRAPGAVVARLRRTVGVQVRRAGPARPFVTLVVVSGDDATHLDGTLSVLRGLPASLELVVLAPPGAPLATAERHREADPRVRLRALGGPGGWWPPALHASRSGRGRYVWVLQPGDRPAADGLRILLRAGRPRAVRAVVGPVAGREPTHGAGSLRSRPELAASLRLGQLLVEARTWAAATRDRRAAAFPGAALLAAIRDAGQVQVTDRPVLREPPRAGQTRRFGASDAATDDLPGWLAGLRAGAEVLEAPDLVEARRAWCAELLAQEAGRYLDDAERLDPEGWAALTGFAASAVEHTGRGRLAEVPVETRAKAWLAARGDQGALVAFVAARRADEGHLTTTVDSTTVDVDGQAGESRSQVRAVLPGLAGAPDWVTALAPSETALVTSLRRLRWRDDGLLVTVFAYVAGVDLRGRSADAEAVLVSDDGRRQPVEVGLRADPEVTRWAGDRHLNHDMGALDVLVPLAGLFAGAPAEQVVWRLRVTVRVAGLSRHGVVRRHDSTGSVPLLSPRTVGGRTVEVRTADDGVCLLAHAAAPATPGSGHPAPRFVVEDFAVTEQAWELSGQWEPEPPDGWRVEVHGPAEPVAVSVTGRPGGGHRIAVSLAADPWGLGPRPLPNGRYRLALGDAGGAVRFADSAAERLPETVLTRRHRAVTSCQSGTVTLTLGAPLLDDEIGPYAQARLQEWYAAVGHRLDQAAVYFQSYDGRSATDSPRAIHEQLVRSRPELRPTWAVRDHAAWVPEGARVVLWLSREWYAALATSAHVVTNIDLEAWFQRRPGQRVLQTFHGYPSKAMGIGLWRAKRHPPTRIERLLRRTSGTWTLLLTPTPEMNRHYREQYAYDGPILDRGYPRDDVLVAGDTAGIRERTRRLLGISANQVAVLYAPTWRDDLATGFRSAPLVDDLDVDTAAQALGDDYVILLRGHRFHARPGARARDRGRVVEVTAYPEINDLVLAADVAVLDYSSLRFDFALTGKPMLFLVPDLEAYAEATRGFLFDFASSAPGPLLRSPSEVVEAVRGLDEVRGTFASRLSGFNATFNRYQDGRATLRAVEAFFGQ
jgi:CDP-glycerol glycerophosphotransferase (TagB/SpsB family)